MHRMIHLAGLMLALAVGGLVGRATQPNAVQAEVRRSPPRAAFESGSERSEKILKDISETLKRIDQRLARIETSVTAEPGR